MAQVSDEEFPTIGHDENQGHLTFMRLFHIITKHWVTAMIGFVLVLILSGVYLVVKSPQYSATAKTFTTYSEISNAPESYASLGSAASYIGTQVKSYPNLVKTNAVLQPVIERLHLAESVSSLSARITATNPTNTTFINITAVASTPEEASDIANAVTLSFQEVVQSSLYASGNQSPVKITVVQKAVPPASPSSPKVALTLSIGIIGGLLIGIIAALLKNLFTRKIQDESELVEYINAPTLGRIPDSDMVASSSSVIVKEPGSPIAEDYRRICTNLSFISPISGTHSRLVVISAVGINEGKTTNAVNVATALAENGSTVLLIDADLRHPSVANKLNIDGSVGLAHVLSGQASVKDVVQRFWKSNLHVMPAGPKPPNAAQLLNSQIMSELINHALQQYDYVIIDTTPLIVANDAAIFTKQGGGLVLVSRRGYTMKKQLTESASELSNLHVEVIGFIFNSAKEDKKLGNSSYYYYYHNDDKGEHTASHEAKGKRSNK